MLRDGELGEGWRLRSAEDFSFNSGETTSLSAGQIGSTGDSGVVASVTESMVGPNNAYQFKTTWHATYGQTGQYGDQGGNGVTADLAVYVKGDRDTPYHLDIEIGTEATLTSTISGYPGADADGSTWRGVDPDPETGNRGVRSFLTSSGQTSDVYQFSTDNTANRSYYEFSDGDVEGITYLGETYKAIWWQNGIDVSAYALFNEAGTASGLASMSITINAWAMDIDIIAQPPEVSPEGIEAKWYVAGNSIPAVTGATVDVYLSADDTISADDFHTFSEPFSGKQLAAGDSVRSMTIPRSSFPGLSSYKYVITSFDHLGRVSETDESNNVSVSALTDIVANFVTTEDSESLSFGYEVVGEIPANTATVSFYFSADAKHVPGDGDTPIKEDVPLDHLTEGVHEQEVRDLDHDALFINLKQKYVLAVFDEKKAVTEINETNNLKFFRKIPVAAIAHGLQPSAAVPSLTGHGGEPDYVFDLQRRLEELGYDVARITDWTKRSIAPVPGMTRSAASEMLMDLFDYGKSRQLSEYDVIDLHFIGHSRGSVVISEALKGLEQDLALKNEDPEKQAVITAMSRGFIRMTMLDGHPANNRTQAYSASWWQVGVGVVGLNLFQLVASDPDIVVPGIVDYSEAYYQNTLTSDASADLASYENLLNLWGVLPVSGKLDDEQSLTGYVGHGQVPVWYTDNVEQLIEPGSGWVVLTTPKTQPTIHPGSRQLHPDGKPHFEWSNSEYYAQFGMRVIQLDETSTRSITSRNSTIFSKDDITETNFTLPESLPHGLYSVTVRGIRDDDSASEWSAPYLFNVLDYPTEVQLSSMVTHVGNSPVLSWDSQSTAAVYVVTLSNDSGETIAIHPTTESRYLPTRGGQDEPVFASVQAFTDDGPLTYPTEPMELTIPAGPQDDVLPTSSVQDVDYADGQLTVTWDGTDDGSGVAFYDVYYAIDGSEEYRALKLRTSDTSLKLDAEPDHEYSFISVATDFLGNVEELPDTPDAIVSTTPVGNDDFTSDIDGDGESQVLTDGILLIRYLAGFRGDSLVSSAVNSGGTRDNAADIVGYLEPQRGAMLDIDGDGQSQPLTDGILFLRYLAGFRGESLTNGAVSASGLRTTPPEVTEWINQLAAPSPGPVAFGPLPVQDQDIIRMQPTGNLLRNQATALHNSTASSSEPTEDWKSRVVTRADSRPTDWPRMSKAPQPSNWESWAMLDDLFASPIALIGAV